MDDAKLQKLKAAEQILLLDSQQEIVDEEKKARIWRNSAEKVRKVVLSIKASLIDFTDGHLIH